ncbi:MAG TPA: serine protease, partial [Candidatus Tectomicrobia bacterium]
ITEVRETREAASSPVLAPPQPAVGRATVERLLGQYQQSSRKTVINLAVALVGVLVMVVGVLVYLNLTTKRQMAARFVNLGEELKITRDTVQVSQHTSPTDRTMSPAEITTEFGPATIYIEVSWKLIHTKSDRQVYHRYEGGGKYPAYIQVGEQIFPWLSTEADNNTNTPIGSEARGSGFVVANNGYILTSRHVAAQWHTRYDDLPDTPSKLFVVDPQRLPLKVLYDPKKPPITDAQQLQELRRRAGQWVPANDWPLVEQRKDGYYLVPGNFEGRFDWLNVTFPKNKLPIPARLVRTSDQHDVALIKIDMPNSVPMVTMYDSYNESRPGDVITILGYPAVSPDVVVRTKSQDMFNRSSQNSMVPDLTVTDGMIGKIIRGEAVPKGGDAYDYRSKVGDVIQLTANATGGGNSGGPVFDNRGRVIGIFFAIRNTDTKITFAVPIRYGMEIMGLKPVLE